jgi:hypothetical protein
LTPLALAFAALSIPILLLYMLKLRRRDVLVSSTLLWQRLLRDREANAPWQRLRRNLLLLLQLLVLALLVVALARPFFPTPTVTTGSVVVLLDASASMQATDVAPSRFEAARQEAGGVIDGLGPDDAATLIAVGPQPAVLASNVEGRAALRRALDQAAVTDGPADWEAAGALAAAALSTTPQAQAVILSDGAVDQALPPLPGQVHFVQVGERADNLAITALAMREGRAGSEAFLRVANFGAGEVETQVELRADGVLFDVRRLTIPAQGSATVTLDDLPYDLGLLQATLLSEDLLPLDDVAWAIRSDTAGLRVLLVTEGNLFLQRALGSLPWLEVTQLVPGQALPDEAYDLIVHDGVITGTLPPGNLWVLGAAGMPTGAFTETKVVRTAAADPILRYVDLDEVQIRWAWRTDLPPGARVLVEARGGPLLTVAERPEGRLAVLSFDLHQSDLPLRVAFPILTANLVNWLLPRTGVGEAATVQPGGPVPIQPAPEADEIRVTGPDERVHPLAIGDVVPVFAATDRVGIYRVDQVDGAGDLLRSDFLAVNLFDPAESDVAPRDVVRVGQAEVTGQVEEAEGQREVWPWLAGLGLVVVTAEWWVYHRGTGQLRSP